MSESPGRQADPKLREWVEANRQALELFQQGAEQSDAAHPAGDPMVTGHCDGYLIGLALAGGEQATKESGDTAGAWECYRAVLRMTTHVRRRGSSLSVRIQRKGNGWCQQATAHDWAADPRTTIPQLRGALEEVLKNEPRPEWDSLCD